MRGTTSAYSTSYKVRSGTGERLALVGGGRDYEGRIWEESEWGSGVYFVY